MLGYQNTKLNKNQQKSKFFDKKGCEPTLVYPERRLEIWSAFAEGVICCRIGEEPSNG